MSISKQIASYIVATQFNDIPKITVETAKKLLLDGIGCLLAGTIGDPGKIASKMNARLAGEAGQSTIIIDGRQCSPRAAAFVNGITLYSVGVNDIHKDSGSHPGGCIIPATLAVGEWQSINGKEMITAMVAGYDVMGRLGRAMMPSHRECGFHPTGTFGAFASTAAVGRLLKLDTKQIISAFGIAGSQAAGLTSFQTDGSLTMIFHAGRAAQNGVESCLLAQEGFTGPHTVFEDRRGGFVHSTSRHYEMDALTHQLGVEFEIDKTAFRPFYGCTYTIAASSATAEILKRNSQKKLTDITQVIVRCHAIVIDEVGDNNPQTLLAARISMEFNVALVIARGDVLVGDVTETDLWNPVIRSLFPLIKFQEDSSMSSWASAVTINYKDGSTETEESLIPKGDPKNPMSWEDTENKFYQLIESIDSTKQGSRIVDLVHNIENTNGSILMKAINETAPSKIS